MNTEAKSTLETILTEKQELVRAYQTQAEHVADEDVHRMLKHFAEAEMDAAVEIKAALKAYDK